MNSNQIKELKNLQNKLDHLYKIKSDYVKQKLEESEEKIKLHTLEQMNQILDQEIKLLYELDNIKIDLTSKLDEFKHVDLDKKKQSPQQIINHLNQSLMQLNKIEFNYEFDNICSTSFQNDQTHEINNIINKTLHNESSTKSNKSKSIKSRHSFKTRYHISTFQIEINNQIWESIHNKGPTYYFRLIDLTDSQLSECNRIKNLLKDQVLTKYGLHIRFNHYSRTTEGYHFNAYCKEKCSSYFSFKINFRDQLCSIRAYIRCFHSNKI